MIHFKPSSRHELLEKMEKFAKASKELTDTIYTQLDSEDMSSAFITSYPFDKSFAEVNEDIQNWNTLFKRDEL